jgi:hypothetical protein
MRCGERSRVAIAPAYEDGADGALHVYDVELLSAAPPMVTRGNASGVAAVAAAAAAAAAAAGGGGGGSSSSLRGMSAEARHTAAIASRERGKRLFAAGEYEAATDEFE